MGSVSNQVLQISVQTVKGLCTENLKCIKKQGHAGDCWPVSRP